MREARSSSDVDAVVCSASPLRLASEARSAGGDAMPRFDARGDEIANCTTFFGNSFLCTPADGALLAPAGDQGDASSALLRREGGETASERDDEEMRPDTASGQCDFGRG